MVTKKNKKKSSAEQYKADRIKEIIIKCLIVLLSIFVSVITPFILLSLRKPVVSPQELIPLFASMSVSIIIIIAIYLIGNTFKTSNPKDYKILKYDCNFEGSIKDRFIEVFGSSVKTSESSELIYTAYEKDIGNDLEEVVITVYYPIDEFFNEDAYVSEIGQIPEVYGDYFAHTMNVIFEETSKSKYLYEIMHSAEYGTANDKVFFSVYDSEKKILSVNKTKDPSGNNSQYFTAKRELNKIFNFQTKNTKVDKNEGNKS